MPVLKPTQEQGARPGTALNSRSPFQVVEAYKTIRANLLFALSTAPRRSVIVTGAEPHSGKSTTSANLAITMAQTGARVLLVDADLRKPTQHKIFRVSGASGLSSVLSGQQPLAAGIRRETLPHLDLIPAGPMPPNPSELLGSERMAALATEMAGVYDYVFFDTPPVNVVSDALMFLNHAGGVLLVARQKKTHYDELEKAAETVRSMEGNVLGVVISDVQQNDKPYGAYQYKYKAYDYEYGKS